MIDKHREQELRSAIELIFFSYRAFTRGPDEILEKRGLGRVHHRILYFVGRDPGLSVNELLKVLQISKKSDRRVRELKLTASGKRLEARLTGTQLLQLESVFASQGKKTEKAWRHVMQQLADD